MLLATFLEQICEFKAFHAQNRAFRAFFRLRTIFYDMMQLEVRSMEKMSMLQKLFIKYGEDGARNPSPRGCYEPVVPEALKAQVLAAQNHTNHKDEQ